MISLHPTGQPNRFVNISSVTTDNHMYQMLYELNESYYSILTEAKDSKSQFKRAIEWLIPNSLRFLTLATKSRHMIGIKARTIDRYCKKDVVFAHRTYLMDSVKVNLIHLPSDISKILENRLDELKKMRNDADRLGFLIKSKTYAIDDLPKWFIENKTLSSMNQYLDGNSPVLFSKGMYTTKDILPRIKTFVDSGLQYLEETKKIVDNEKKGLDKVKAEFKEYSKVNTENAKSLELALQYFDAGIESVYMQLGLYYRSVMYLYGKYLTDIQRLVDIIYEDINDDKIKSHNFDDLYDDIKGFTKSLI